MSITIRSAQTIRNGITLRGNTPAVNSLPILFELDASNYTSGTTLLDISGNDRHATIYGSPTWSSNAGGCFVFPADASKYIEVQDSTTGWGLNTAADNPNASFSVWAKISAYGYYQHVAGWRGGLNFWFLIPGGGTVEARFDGGTAYDIGMDYSPYYDNWAQTTFVVDSANSQTRLYINSVLVGNYDGITGSFGEGVSGFRLGLDGVGNNFAANGAIGGATAYSRALTQEEVTSEFNRTKTRYGL
jgi:hypothetical protein